MVINCIIEMSYWSIVYITTVAREPLWDKPLNIGSTTLTLLMNDIG